MQALLVIAHGSRRQGSNEEVKRLTATLAAQLAADYPIVECGFLELAAPLIPEAIGRCVEQGATSIRIVPYFLAAGRHVIEDIPGIVEETAPHYPDVAIDIAPHIGAAKLMSTLIQEVAAQG